MLVSWNSTLKLGAVVMVSSPSVDLREESPFLLLSSLYQKQLQLAMRFMSTHLSQFDHLRGNVRIHPAVGRYSNHLGIVYDLVLEWFREGHRTGES